MTTQHISGGSIAALIAYCSVRYGWGIGLDEAGIIGAAAFSVGAGVVHLATGPGLIPAVKRALFGQPK